MKSLNICAVYSEKLLNIFSVFFLYFECIINIYVKKNYIYVLGNSSLPLSSDINTKIKTGLLPPIISVIFKEFVFVKICAKISVWLEVVSMQYKRNQKCYTLCLF